MQLNEYSIPVLNSKAAREIYRAARWGKFISIVGFIFSLLFFLLGLIFPRIVNYMSMYNPQIATMPAWFFIIMYCSLGILYMFPCLFLFLFSVKSKRALLANNEELLASSFGGLRRCFQFIGVVTLIIIVLYILFIAGLILGSVLGLSFM